MKPHRNQKRHPRAEQQANQKSICDSMLQRGEAQEPSADAIAEVSDSGQEDDG